MEENANQGELLEDLSFEDDVEVDLFEDDAEETEETLEETTSDVTEVETESTEATEDKIDLGEVEVKYLHESKKLKDIPAEDLKVYVQKGMNHDRVLEKYTVANEKLEAFSFVAQLHEMSVDQMAEVLLKNYAESKAESEGKSVESVMADINGKQQAIKQKQFERFVNKYPDVKSDQIPQEVWDATKLGDDLVTAYGDYLSQNTFKAKDGELNQLKTKIAELEGKLKTKEQNETVRKKAVVTSTSKNGIDNIKDDEFLQGLLG